MPGITDVALIPHTRKVAGGVAVRGDTFGQCIDAIRALSVEWGPGPADGKSDASVLADLKKAELPVPPPVNLLAKTLDQRFTFHFRPGDPLETNCAIADVRPDSAEVWSSLKTPIWAQEQIALDLGLPVSAVKTHVTQGGGSFGRHLFADAAFEAVAISKAMGKPVKLMWHRTDNFRQGRVHPMITSRVRALHLAGNVLTFDQRNTGVATDLGHGLGELLSAKLAEPGVGNLGYAQFFFTLTANVPYNFGVVTQLLNEVYEPGTFNTSSVRNVYSPEVTTPRELMVDQLAKAMGQDPLQFRRAFVREARMRAVLDKVAAGRQLGPRDGARHGAGPRHPPGVQGLCRLPGRDRLPAGDRQPQGRARLHRAACDEGRVRGRRRPADQPARSRGPDDGRDHGRDRPGPELQPAPQGRVLPGGQLGRRLLHEAVEHARRTSRSS